MSERLVVNEVGFEEPKNHEGRNGCGNVSEKLDGGGYNLLGAASVVGMSSICVMRPFHDWWVGGSVDGKMYHTYLSFVSYLAL